jgi:hypothetical protein
MEAVGAAGFLTQLWRMAQISFKIRGMERKLVVLLD